MVSSGQHRGFTLIEVLISMAIIGVSLIALLTLFPLGLRSSRLAGDFTTAAFIGQQVLDNIRANAQVYDPGDMMDEDNDGDLFDDPNGNGLGYYDLPIPAVKGRPWNIRFPTQPTQSQTWTITITSDHSPPGTLASFDVTNSISGLVGSGTVNTLFASNAIEFILVDNQDGSAAPPYGWLTVFNEGAAPFDNSDIDYPEFVTGDQIIINLEMRGGVPYYWYAMRAPVTEDRDLDGILDGRLPNGTARSVPHNLVHEDTGIDLVPDFWDTDMRDIGTGTAGYQSALDKPGEFASAPFPSDTHGDNKYAYTTTAPYWWNTTAEINPNGTEGNGQIDAGSDDFIQKVTLTVGWREGGQDRTTTFSAAIPNQFR